MKLKQLTPILVLGSRATLRILGEAVSPASCASSSSSKLLRPPIGLRNLGNTCYINAQLQCHFHIPYVRQLIMGDAVSSINKENTTLQQSSNLTDSETMSSPPPVASGALLALRHVFRDMYQSSIPVAPSILCMKLGINAYEQQDSQEFWKLLLPAIALPALTDLYQGAYIDYIVALDGSKREKRREETFLDLSLDLQSSDGSLDTALASLFGPPELLSVAQGNGWRPEKGADKVDAHKGSILTAQGLPPILQLHLKRFNYDWNTETTVKLNCPLAFPLELDLGSLCDKKGQGKVTPPPSYDLQSIVVHVGEYGAGHYYAYVRMDVTSDNWFRFNDQEVVKVLWEEVLADASNAAIPKPTCGRGMFARLSRALFPKRTTHGYGGRSSSAYVLQYVRRSDLPMLYLDNS
ncbi:hypothetical protein MPSEU_000483400 [Mayamaea pseudoterrestris]|nr:hypothetical protein MPSEU_000483400 [Mayamaea pseudoterrestris]